MSDDAHDVSAERALLGSALMFPDVAGAALLSVPNDAWFLPQHAEIAAVITERLKRDKSVDSTVIVPDLLARRGHGADYEGILATLAQRMYAPVNANEYAQRILYCAARRQLAAAATRLRMRLDQSWVNGWNEPISDITSDMRHCLESAETSDVLEASTELPTLEELLAIQNEYDWLVPGLLERRDRVILTGSEGIGKSWMASQMAVCLASGLHPFTGQPVAEGHQVLVVDCENSLMQSQRRFRNLVARIDKDDSLPKQWRRNLHVALRPNGVNLLGEDAAWLERSVERVNPDLLVVGPLYRLHYTNMNDEQAAREIVRVIDNLRTKYDCAVLTEAHAGHALNGSGTRSMRPAGSSLFLRWPEFGYGLSRSLGAEERHPELVDVIPWRGAREERQWPERLRHGSFLPWEPADREYWEENG